MSGVSSLFKKTKVKKAANVSLDDDANVTAAVKPKKKSSKKTVEEEDDEWKSSATTTKKAVVVSHTKGKIEEFSKNDRDENATSDADILLDDSTSREDKLKLLETKNLLQSVFTKNKERLTTAEQEVADKAAAATAAAAAKAEAEASAASATPATEEKPAAPSVYNAMERIKARLGANNSLTSGGSSGLLRKPAVPTGEEFPELSAALAAAPPAAPVTKQSKERAQPPAAPITASVSAVQPAAAAPAPEAAAPAPVAVVEAAAPAPAAAPVATEVSVAAADSVTVDAACDVDVAAAAPVKKKKKAKKMMGDIDLDSLVIE